MFASYLVAYTICYMDQDNSAVPTETPGSSAAPTPPAAGSPLAAPTPSQPTPTPSPPPPTGPAKVGFGSVVSSSLIGIVNWVIVPVAIVLVLHFFVFQAFHVVGTSMVPTLHDTDYLIVSKVGATESEAAGVFGHASPYIPKRQQVIVFHYPKDPTLIFVKRVIALPGERVVVTGGHVTVYNSTHAGGFDPDTGTVRAKTPTLGDIDEVIPAGEIFVLGDNRTPNGSFDSRDWGTLPYHYIIGDAVIRLLPVNQAGFF